jgi:HSP20 family protein
MSTVADPLGTLRPLREEDVHELTREHESHGTMPLAYDVYRDGQELVIEFDAPGVAPGDIALVVEGRTVDVSLGRNMARGRGIDVIEAGRQHGTFRQRLWLGDRWDTDRLTARAENGVLTVRAPLAARAPRRAVPVTTRPPLEEAATPPRDEPAAATYSDEDEHEVHSAA